jgi:hypothetical protein
MYPHRYPRNRSTAPDYFCTKTGLYRLASARLLTTWPGRILRLTEILDVLRTR